MIVKIRVGLASDLLRRERFWTEYVRGPEVRDRAGPCLIADLTETGHGVPEEGESVAKIVTGRQKRMARYEYGIDLRLSDELTHTDLMELGIRKQECAVENSGFRTRAFQCFGILSSQILKSRDRRRMFDVAHRAND